MNIFDIENKKEFLVQRLQLKISSRRKFVLILHFLHNLQNGYNRTIFEAYSSEFLPLFYKTGKNFSINCLDIDLTKNILIKIESLQENDLIDQDELHLIRKGIEDQVSVLQKIMEGDVSNLLPKNKAFFPLLEFDKTDEENFGIMDSVSVLIKDSGSKTLFHIMPSETEIEERIRSQIDRSWEVALEYSKNVNKRIKPHHEVFISFDAREGFYVGNSLGISLTISFIEEILRFYNSPVVVDIKDRIAFTGGVDIDGRIPKIGDESIKRKCESVFFSAARNFVVPRDDETHARFKLESLKKRFPERKLEITGVENLHDLLNRRNIVDIKKQSPAKRSYNFVKRNYAAVLLLVIIIGLVGSYLYFNIDQNPAYFENRGNTLFVMNDEGQVLWSKKMGFDLSLNEFVEQNKVSQKIIDIDDDGINEILLANEYIKEPDFGRLACFDYKGNLLWEYTFKGIISTKYEEFTPQHTISMQIGEIDSSKKIYLFTRHKMYYPSAVFKFDLKTQKVVGDTLWHAGAITSIMVSEDSSGNKIIIANGVNSSFNSLVLFTIDEENLRGEGPANDFYDFENLKLTEFRNYIVFPNSDFTNYRTLRYEALFMGELDERDNYYIFNAHQDFPPYTNHGSIIYYVRKDFREFKINVDDSFHMRRDSLVLAGKLDIPLTNTIEYRNILEEQIRYWDGEKLATHEEYFKN